MIIFVTVFLLLMTAITIVPLIRKRKQKEAIVSLLAYILSYVELLLYILKARVPSYLELIQLSVKFFTNP
ncbi:MAG: hypothetical protein MJA31_16980 [Clostridia bacterium]|nr:hypothetical protein [Clostridia bacterium]